MKPVLSRSKQAVISGSAPDLQDKVTLALTEQVRQVCMQQFGGALRALVLTGSFARKEATVVCANGVAHVLGDAEFLAIFADNTPLPDAGCVGKLCNDVRVALQRINISCDLSLGVGHMAYLRTMPPHIFGYELRSFGLVVWGDRDILSIIPNFSATEIPLEDGWRLLCNRMIEQLAPHLEGEISKIDSVYRTAKLFLDTATSLLVFRRRFEPSYRGRVARLRELIDDSVGDVPFSLQPFSQYVEVSTEYKLTGNRGLLPADATTFLREAVDHVHKLWRWELAQMGVQPLSLADDALIARWMRQLSLWRRLRGWSYVVRRQRSQGRPMYWLRWLTMLRQGSPRHCTYRAAHELFWNLPLLGTNRQTKTDFDDLHRYLPVAHTGTTNQRTWHSVAADVVWNYREFVVETRS